MPKRWKLFVNKGYTKEDENISPLQHDRVVIRACHVVFCFTHTNRTARTLLQGYEKLRDCLGISQAASMLPQEVGKDVGQPN